MWAIPTGISSIKKKRVPVLSLAFRKPVRIRQSGRAGKRGVTIKLQLFPFSLRDVAATWFESLPIGSVNNWEELVKTYMSRFFLHALTSEMRGEIIVFMSHPDSRPDPNGGSKPGSGRETELGLFTCFFFFKADLGPVGIQTIFVITKIIYIYKRTTTVVVFTVSIHIY